MHGPWSSQSQRWITFPHPKAACESQYSAAIYSKCPTGWNKQEVLDWSRSFLRAETFSSTSQLGLWIQKSEEAKLCLAIQSTYSAFKCLTQLKSKGLRWVQSRHISRLLISKEGLWLLEEAKPARHKRDTGQCIPQRRAGHKGVIKGGERDAITPWLMMMGLVVLVLEGVKGKMLFYSMCELP